jgi:hypothetical protein
MRLSGSLVMVALAVTVAGCAPAAPAADSTVAQQTAALEELVSQAQGTAATVLATTGDIYSDLDVVAVPPATMECDFTFSTPTDPAAADAYFRSVRPTLQGLADSQFIPSMRTAGITSPRVTFTFLNPDGSLVWTGTFDPS